MPGGMPLGMLGKKSSSEPNPYSYFGWNFLGVASWYDGAGILNYYDSITFEKDPDGSPNQRMGIESASDVGPGAKGIYFETDTDCEVTVTWYCNNPTPGNGNYCNGIGIHRGAVQLDDTLDTALYNFYDPSVPSPYSSGIGWNDLVISVPAGQKLFFLLSTNDELAPGGLGIQLYLSVAVTG